VRKGKRANTPALSERNKRSSILAISGKRNRRKEPFFFLGADQTEQDLLAKGTSLDRRALEERRGDLSAVDRG